MSIRILLVAVFVLATAAFGQVTTDGAFQVRYAANLNFGDSVINTTNTGARGADLQSGTSASITRNLRERLRVFAGRADDLVLHLSRDAEWTRFPFGAARFDQQYPDPGGADFHRHQAAGQRSAGRILQRGRSRRSDARPDGMGFDAEGGPGWRVSGDRDCVPSRHAQ